MSSFGFNTSLVGTFFSFPALKSKVPIKGVDDQICAKELGNLAGWNIPCGNLLHSYEKTSFLTLPILDSLQKVKFSAG